MKPPEEPSDDRLRWPAEPPLAGRVRLRAFADDDHAMVLDAATDPYVATISSLPAGATTHQAEAAGYARERLLRRHQEIAGVRRDMRLYAAIRP